jgi:transposase
MSGILGIDVSKAKLDVCLLRDDQRPAIKMFANTPSGFEQLVQWVQQRQVSELHACLEATGRYGEGVALFLHEQGYTVSMVNPAQVKAHAQSQLQRNKTDKQDAALIADFCRKQRPPAWIPPDPVERELQALVRHYDDLKVALQQHQNRLEAGVTSPLVVAHLQAQVTLLQQQMDEVRRQINDHLDQHPDLKRQRDLLTSIPGLGDLTAAKLLAEFRDIRRFQDVRQLVAFAGLNPRHRQSGSSVRGHPHISKMGRASLRAALYMPAVSALNHNPILRTFAERLRQRGLRGKAVVVAVMRKLLHLVYGILKSGQPFDPDYLLKCRIAS